LDHLSQQPGWLGVAGDEAELSTKMVQERVGKFDFRNHHILDFGCGPGRLFEAYFNQGSPERIVGMDLNERMLERARAHFETISMSKETKFVPQHADERDLARQQS
jgi:ubiquinone/menaquinone biosynthesis C-methylase UbiE